MPNYIPNPSAKLPKPDYPSWQEYTIVPVGVKGAFNPPQGSKDFYEVKLWLATYKDICMPDALNIDNPEPEPDSYIHIKVDTGDPKTSIAKLKLDLNNNLQVFLEPNKYGRLSQIIMELEANNFRGAIDKAYSSVAPFLSHWSFVLNLPVLINAIKATMKSTGSTRLFALFDGKTKLFPVNISQYSFKKPEHLGIIGLYREVLNIAVSPFYQVFLLHRIREGIYKTLRGNKFQDKTNELIFQNCNEVHKVFRSLSFSEVHRKIKRKFRDHFAHFNLTKGRLLKQSPDRFANFFECVTKWLPVSFYITQKMIENELNPRI